MSNVECRMSITKFVANPLRLGVSYPAVTNGRVVKLADTRRSERRADETACEFDSRLGYCGWASARPSLISLARRVRPPDPRLPPLASGSPVG